MIATSRMCPDCLKEGRKVKRVTLESLLHPECHAEISAEQYYVCTTPTCDTAYFSAEGSRVFSKSDLTVRFGLKETDSPRPVCYCFDHTIEEIADEMRRTGESTVMERIREAMKGPGCRCEYTNPLGGCCLQTVQTAISEARHSVEDCRQGDLVAGRVTWFVFWGIPIAAFLLAGLLWPVPRTLVSATALFWAGAGCLINASRCGRLHCYFTGPLFVLGGVVVILGGFDVVAIGRSWIGIGVLGGVFLAYLSEWIRGNRYLGRAEGNDPAISVAAGCCAAQRKGGEPMVSAKSDCCGTENKLTQESSVGDRAGALAAGGSVVAAILSSACCWLPLLLIGFGASAAGVAAFFEAHRLSFVLGAVGMLGVGFYLVYFRQGRCAPGTACATPGGRLRNINRGMLWAATVLVAGFVFFPNYVGYVLGRPASTPVANTGSLASVVYRIEGMTCPGCAERLRGELATVPGVAGVDVDYSTKTAVVRYAPGKRVVPDRVIAAAKAAGYRASVSALQTGEKTSQTEEKTVK